MEDNKIIKLAAVGFLVIVVAPIVIGGVINVVGKTTIGVCNAISKAKFKKEIKKGLKNGTIVEKDGEYYEVKMEEAK